MEQTPVQNMPNQQANSGNSINPGMKNSSNGLKTNLNLPSADNNLSMSYIVGGVLSLIIVVVVISFIIFYGNSTATRYISNSTQTTNPTITPTSVTSQITVTPTAKPTTPTANTTITSNIADASLSNDLQNVNAAINNLNNDVSSTDQGLSDQSINLN